MSRRNIITLVVMALLAVLPPVFYLTGNAFYLDLATRLTILAIAAVSLNLILGYGGLISFGHAAYLGIGAYAVGIPAHHWLYGGLESLGLATTSGYVQIPLAIGVAALFALVTGAICLRTKGVYFIMITMAFAQMMYYAIVSIEEYGGDDGLVIDSRSELPFIDLDDPLQLFGLAYVSLVVAMLIVRMIVNSRFGMVLRGAKGNNERVVMLGFNTYLFRLTAYVIAGAMAGYAGALLGNFTTFISPEMMDWGRSGELMFMVILGGTATLVGPVIGATLFIVLEEVLSSLTVYWHLPFGLLLLAVVLFGKGGIMGMLRADKEDSE
ncbi:amino acid/amide ABC transporter membrane protein 2 (HAAT family) [Maritimibacter alkaliphilus HTCC2654]|uniref:ABC transporter permease protein n=1 Tax=Maritimibacter alkaliphilus HTCC2654 TaxID=314271 RepID=A3VBR6_9RHOB|nr:branched-chain amino acid ABC transporter permease [Maritimibacter alkaliphilus]EAQ14399.1 ABC transporter permease protein [Rhodobacterales bacterium HTCC2654] [Maritimibacter alkaliphilus HTCC2654]TYP82510.1 amino acid/amide ABC transporter membrane protein 2 (HAAT family) [Maritimibacter alkaliphilus HTCC2654]